MKMWIVQKVLSVQKAKVCLDEGLSVQNMKHLRIASKLMKTTSVPPMKSALKTDQSVKCLMVKQPVVV